MTITDATCYRYTLPLTAPLALGDRSVDERHGVLLRLTLDGAATGWGDAAPLPGFSAEAVDAAAADLRALAERLPGRTLPRADVDRQFAALPRAPSASARFAVESAALDALAAAQGTTPAALLGAGRDAVAINALVTDAGPDLAPQGRKVRAAGYRAVKLKVGRTDVDTDVRRTRTLRDGLGPDVALRLDANRAWSWDQAVAFTEATDDLAPAYIEEPLATPAQLPDFVAATGCPVALDETTREIEPESLPDVPLRAVVLKPTLLGGVAAARRWAEAARLRGATPVVSASYESGVGLRTLAALAAALSDAPAGLGTYARLGTDVLSPRLPLSGPEVRLDAVRSSAVVPDRLTPA